MDYVVDALIDFSGSQEEELRDIAGLGWFSSKERMPFISSYASFQRLKL
ncbi:MAG TPA: hypothetical protein VGO47_03430 [Chlamydiales bacterium]|jgi:cullin-associated NEDD8-dissociated protein 1|nr:hypothetical protein [Chlamydiales bacterium]